jgi:stearoyl-CoA desaturase (delta-9 desaturase)
MLITIAVALAVAVASMQLSTFSTTIYLHRAMAHKGLRLHPAVAFLMRLQLWIFTGIVTREWVAVHRKHHHFTDIEGDPHSPYLKGLWPVLLWNAIYYAREANQPETIDKYTRDMPHTRGEVVLSRGWLGVTLGLSAFVYGFWLLAGGWVGPLIGAATFGVQAIGYITLNALINGACHAVGYRNFSNTATNLRFVAWITGGEGLHNNHHQYPAAAKLAMNRRRLEFDPAWAVIKFLSWFSLAEPLPLPHRTFGFSETLTVPEPNRSQ